MDKPTWTYKEDLPDQPNGRLNVEAMQEEYLIERIGRKEWTKLSELTVQMMEGDMKYNEIKQPCLYGYQVENYVWQQVEKAAVKGFLAGALVMCIIWMIVLGV